MIALLKQWQCRMCSPCCQVFVNNVVRFQALHPRGNLCCHVHQSTVTREYHLEFNSISEAREGMNLFMLQHTLGIFKLGLQTDTLRLTGLQTDTETHSPQGWNVRQWRARGLSYVVLKKL